MVESSTDLKTLTKNDIVENVHKKLGVSKKEAFVIVERIFEIIKSRLTQSEQVKLSGFGKFSVRSKKARRGRNPQTGQEITITPRKVLSFKASQILREAMLNTDNA
jgi:integration host factor subunit alpha